MKFADDAFIDDARVVSGFQNRSLAGQIMHWARIGRAIERSGSFDYAKISRVFTGELETGALTAEEKAVCSDVFLDKMSNPSPDEVSFFADLHKSGKAVGLDASGKIVRAGVQADE
ncbi:ParD-like family protein [Roseovarius sp. THAF27]|uniref:ParD-like family protein n=1 Tax=Roseovarius sp. THAF27 TaxID=2587850 RepID=UPI0020C781B2|nr:ParD-like family protein [Roseovarius sp. THAF27]